MTTADEVLRLQTENDKRIADLARLHSVGVDPVTVALVRVTGYLEALLDDCDILDEGKLRFQRLLGDALDQVESQVTRAKLLGGNGPR